MSLQRPYALEVVLLPRPVPFASPHDICLALCTVPPRAIASLCVIALDCRIASPCAILDTI